MSEIKYQIYPSLIDAYSNYLSSAELYQKYWGWSDNPSTTLEEWEKEKFQDIINSLNRVPFDSVYADIGTVFNELVDCLILNKKSNRIEDVERVYKIERFGAVDECGKPIFYDENHTDEVVALKAKYNGRSYQFPIKMVRSFADMYRGAVPQMYVEGMIETSRGNVKLYGFLDELMPFSVHDIKTTNSYESWKFKNNVQHLVYPYCLSQMGMPVSTFSYDIAEIRSNAKKSDQTNDIVVSSFVYHREEYGFDYERAEETLRAKCEDLIDFIEEHRSEITNKKLFCEE